MNKSHPTGAHNAAVRNARTRQAGFTLIELMITVAIIGILSAIAYPSYIEHLRKGRRVDAKTALLDVAARQERFFSTQNLYTSTLANVGYSSSSIVSSGTAYYLLSITVGTPATTYTAKATRTGLQVPDTCGDYAINELGVQSNSGNTTATSQCW